MMKITGKRSISTIIKIFLIILFIICILSIITIPIFIEKCIENYSIKSMIKEKFGVTIIFMYLSSIPALIMIYQFIQIFISFEQEKVFETKLSNRLLISAICCIFIGITYLLNFFCTIKNILNFEYSTSIVYIFLSIITSLIFLILGVGLIVLKDIYKTAIKNKEENDLTI